MAIHDWSLISGLDDDFFSRFFLISNYGISLIMQFSLWMLRFNNGYQFAILKGSHTNALFYTPTRLIWLLFIGIVISILLICGIVIVHHKIKNNNVVHPIILNGGLNNIAHNMPLLSIYQAFFLSFIVAFSSIFLIIIKYNYNYKNYPPSTIIQIQLTIHLFVNIIFPITLVSRKKYFLKYLLREIRLF